MRALQPHSTAVVLSCTDPDGMAGVDEAGNVFVLHDARLRALWRGQQAQRAQLRQHLGLHLWVAADHEQRLHAGFTLIFCADAEHSTLADSLRTHAIVWPVVSKPPVKKTPISAAMRSSGSGRPVAGSRMRSRCAAMVASSSAGGPRACTSASSSAIIRWNVRKSSSPLRTDCFSTERKDLCFKGG